MIILRYVGIAFIVLGIASEVFIMLAMPKWAAKYTDKKFSEYADEDIIPDEKARHFFKKGIRKITFFVLIPYLLILLGLMMNLLHAALA